jgi:hypothetical protein
VPERKCNQATRTGRLSKAEQFEHAAELIEDYAGESDDLNDAYITMCIHAGIAAADVICCARLGVHHQGENHSEAVSLLQKVDRALAGDLDSLLKMKTAAGYGADPSSGANRKRATRTTRRLMDAARLAR